MHFNDASRKPAPLRALSILSEICALGLNEDVARVIALSILSEICKRAAKAECKLEAKLSILSEICQGPGMVNGAPTGIGVLSILSEICRQRREHGRRGEQRVHGFQFYLRYAGTVYLLATSATPSPLSILSEICISMCFFTVLGCHLAAFNSI